VGGGWVFAKRESQFRPSPVRAVFELALDPAYVSLTGGNPDTSMLPAEQIAEIAARLLRERGAEMMQYGSGAGVDSLAETVAGLMTRVGASVDRSNLLITTGSQMGIDLCCKLLCNPGDVVLAEGPTYVGAMGVFGAYEVDLQQTPIDDDGRDPDAVAAALDALAAHGRPARFLYAIPHHQNPSGVTLSRQRRQRLVEVCAERGVPIVEDDPYAFVGFPGVDPLPSLYSFNPAGVIYLGSMSKLFSPGMRVGWMCAAPEVRDRLQIAGESVDIHPSVLAQEIVHAWVGTPAWDEALGKQRAAYAQRCSWTLAALEAAGLPAGVTWTRPSGGFFTWLTLPGVDPATDVLSAAIEQQLVIVPGNACFTATPQRCHVRLAFSNSSHEDVTEGVRRLALTVQRLSARR